MKKILIVGQETLERAGVQNVIMSIVRNLHEEFEFDIILRNSRKEEYDDEFLSYGGQIFRCLPLLGENALSKRLDYYIRGDKLYRYTRRIIRKHGPYQAIHCHDALESAVFLKAAFKEGIPIRLVHSHHVFDISSENPIAQMLDSRYMSMIKKYATKYMGDSDKTNITHFGINSEAVVIKAPYDDIKFDPTRYDLKKRDTKLIITQVGQYCPNKNQIFTVDTFSEIVKLYPNAQLNFVGFDSIGYLPTISERIKKHGLQDKVKFYPQNTDIPLLLSQSDAFMFPSYTEGFGIAAVEAQAMGVRCYASDTIPLTTNCGGCTYLSLSLKPREWAEIILNDFKNSDERTVYDCSAYKSAAVKEEYRRIYSGLM